MDAAACRKSAPNSYSLDVLHRQPLQSLSGEPVPWSDLPADVLAMIGGQISCTNQLNNATKVCRHWNQAIPSGVERLELDMNPCNQAWGAKVEQLQRLTPSLSRCKAHVSTAVPKMAFGDNIRQLAAKLQNIQHLDLELSEGFELWLEAGDELSELRNLRSLTLSGGLFTAAAAERLLCCLALSCPLLEELHVLPEPTCGLGDEQVDHLLALTGLKVLDFRACRLTASGLTRLATLPILTSLSCHGLDTCLDAATASCFANSRTLQQLHLGCDYEVPEAALEQLRSVAGGLSMCFRWTDKLTGLLRTARLHLQSRLVKLDLGCVRLARDPTTTLMEPLAALTALSDLRMRVYSNADTPLTLHISQLNALTNLQVLHLTKQHAYYPEHRRFSESNISVPLCAKGAARLAGGCRRLRALRLCLGASDVTAEGLAALKEFRSLKSLSVHAEPFGSPPAPVPLDLLDLPPGLTHLELRNIDVITTPDDLAAAAAVAAAAPTTVDLAAASAAAAASVAAAAGPATADMAAAAATGGNGGACAADVVSSANATGVSPAAAAYLPYAGPVSSVTDRDMWPTGQGADMQDSPAGVWVPAAAVPGGEQGCSGSSSSCSVSSDCGASSSGGSSRRSSEAGGGGARGVLQQLESFKLESCRLKAPQLQALCPSLVSLQQLKLSHVAGLSDVGVCGLSCLTGLTELCVLAPSNKSVSQNSLAALAPLRDVRYLTWQSDDLTALGPVVSAYTHFTTLRALSLSCTNATLDRACGEDGQEHFARIMPYCRMDFIR